MKIFEQATLHPALGNEHRDEVIDWCKDNMGSDMYSNGWYVGGHYTKHGSFRVELVGEDKEHIVTAFLLQFPNTQILEIDYRYELEPANETLELFEGLYV